MTSAVRSVCLGLFLLFVLSGCDAVDVVVDLLDPATVRVTLINNGQFDVEGTLFYDDEQDLPQFVLTEVGRQLDFTVSAGDSFTFERSCDDLQTIIIEDADLLVAPGVSPETSTGVLRDGDDFSCGDSIVFTFDHSEILVDFNVTESIEGG